MNAILPSDQDFANRALLAAIFADHQGNCAALEALCQVAALLSARQNPQCQVTQPKVDFGAVDGSQSEHLVRNWLTICPLSSPLPSRARSPQGARMVRHQWLYSLLKDVVAFAAINEMPQVARHTAEALYALELQQHEYDRKARVLTRMAADANPAFLSAVVRFDGVANSELREIAP